MKLFKITLFLGLFTAFLPFANANLSISPLKYEFTINTWETKTETIKVTNNDKTPITLYTSKEDFIAWDDSGTPTFVKPQDQKTEEYSLSNWITSQTDNLTLAPGETREVSFTVSVPKNWEPGWHYGAIFFSPGTPNSWQVAVVQRLWVLVLVNIPGNIRVAWDLSNFDLWTKNDKEFKSSSEFDNFPIYFETKFKNDGNIHIKPKWKVVLIDDSWEVLKNIWKESLTSPAGAFIWEKMVDYIPVNDWLGNVLPKSERKFESIWEWFGYQELKEDWAKIVKFKNLTDYYASKAAEKRAYLQFWEQIHQKTVNKQITANLTLEYEWKDKEKKEFKKTKTFTVKYNEQYVWVNYTVVIVIIIIIGWIIYYFAIFVPKSKEKLKKQLLEEMNKK